MGQWLDIKGPVVADTVYSGGVLVAKDVTFTLPGIEFLTADVQAMGNLTVPRRCSLPRWRIPLRRPAPAAPPEGCAQTPCSLRLSGAEINSLL